MRVSPPSAAGKLKDVDMNLHASEMDEAQIRAIEEHQISQGSGSNPFRAVVVTLSHLIFVSFLAGL